MRLRAVCRATATQSTVVRFHFTSQALALLFTRSHISLRQPFCRTSAFTNRLSLNIFMLQLHCSWHLRRFLHAVTSMHILRRPWRRWTQEACDVNTYRHRVRFIPGFILSTAFGWGGAAPVLCCQCCSSIKRCPLAAFSKSGALDFGCLLTVV